MCAISIVQAGVSKLKKRCGISIDNWDDQEKMMLNSSVLVFGLALVVQQVKTRPKTNT